MPTRIVLKESVAPRYNKKNANPARTPTVGNGAERQARSSADAGADPYPPPREPKHLFQTSRRRKSVFRSSIFQNNRATEPTESNVETNNQIAGEANRAGEGYDDIEEDLYDDDASGPWNPDGTVQRSGQTTHSRYASDIRASPRLLGYVFALTACAIMLASVIQFYRAPGTVPPQFQDYFNSQRYFVTSTNTVILWWKVWGAIAVSSAGCLVYLLIIVAHFNTICLPNLWVRFFRDGSLAERNLLLLLIVFWVAGLTISTGSLSVGESQPNVFFTTWIAFSATVNNLAVWRESAGLPSFLSRHGHARDTTYNWLWTAFFSLILAGSVSDIYVYRDEITLQSDGQKLNVSQQTWIIVLSVVWAEVGICFTALLLNRIQVEPFTLPCHCRRGRHREESVRCVFGWRHLEGLVLILSVGGKYYVVLKYTGVDTVINGLSNSYIGMWGTFFSSVSTFGTWLKENRNITYFVPDKDGSQQAVVEDVPQQPPSSKPM